MASMTVFLCISSVVLINVSGWTSDMWHNSQKFRDLCHISEVQPDTFIRTTDEMHKKTVIDLWNKLINAKTNLNSKYDMIWFIKTYLGNDKYITKGIHEGYYSVNDECFYMEKDLFK